MFAQRAAITFTLLPIALYAIVRGEWFYFIPITLILMVATVEYTSLMQRLGWKLPLWLMLPAVFLQLVAGQWPDLGLLAPGLLMTMFVILAHVLWSHERKLSATAPSDWMAMMGGVMLLGWVGSHFFRLRGLGDMAWQWTMLAMLGTWMADSAAYVVGRFLAGTVLGRHKLSPRLSPNKTVEGYLGGVLFGTSITILLASAFQFPVFHALLLGILVSAVSPIGDLGISLLKREAGVKDSGTLFLGHGGALDRTDSLIWSVALAFYLAQWMG